MKSLITGSLPLHLRNGASSGRLISIRCLRCPNVSLTGVSPQIYLLRAFHTTLRNLVHPVKFQEVPKLHDIERILGDPLLQAKYLHDIQHSKSHLHSVHSMFENAINMATGEYSYDAYVLVLKLWEIVFLRGFSDVNLQRKLIHSKPKVLHLMMNNGEYKPYETLIRPVYTMGHLGAKPSWTDTLISTFQFSRDGDRLRYSRQSILTFLKSDRSLEDKRLLISIFLRKCLLYSESPSVLPGVLRDFLAFLDQIGDGHLLFNTSEYSTYKNALRMIITPYDFGTTMETIENVVMETTESKNSFSRFISSLMFSISTSDPERAVTLWNYKTEKLNTNMLEYRDHNDLLSVMNAYLSLKAFDRVWKVHSENTLLQHDDQIDILLRVSEQTRDWKLLQKQFEDMYGHNQLPHVVHYAIVMSALASLGVLKEVEQLYQQILKRNLQPTAEVFSALILANSNTGNVEGARKWYATFLQAVEEGIISEEKIAGLQTKLVEADILDKDVGTTLEAFRNILESQESSGKQLVNSELVCKMLAYLTMTYREIEFNEVLDMARKYLLINEQVYCRTVSSLTQFGQYERADELAFEAHLESVVPFASAAVTRVQFRNYRAWYKSTSNREIRRYLADRVTNIIKRVDAKKISPRDMDHLLVDIIKHYVSLNKLRAAGSYFERVRKMHRLTEEHYLPFLEHNASLNTYEGYAQILEKYREMAKLKVSISARTYLYLIRALLHMDKVNHTGFENSYKLLESVFELYGMSTVDNIAGSNIAMADLSRNSPNLLRIISEYSVATTGHSDKGMVLAVKFLNQIKEKLGKRISPELRMAILQEMSKIYFARGDFQGAHDLLNNAMGEINSMIDQDNGSTSSKVLQIKYRQLASLLLRVFQQIDAKPSSYDQVLEQTLQRNVRLSGKQYSEISLEVLKMKTPRSLNRVLEACERYLVSGNWIEIKIRRKIQYIYKLFVVYLSRTLSRETIASKYQILNEYYNTCDLDLVIDEFKHIRDPLGMLSQEVEAFNGLNPGETWTTGQLLRDLPRFFIPERKIPTTNIITPTLASALFNSIETHCGGNREPAFSLYDHFPESMEYLLYFGEERTRTVAFRKKIDKLVPPSKSAHKEDSNSRRERALEALDHLRITTSDIDSI